MLRLDPRDNPVPVARFWILAPAGPVTRFADNFCHDTAGATPLCMTTRHPNVQPQRVSLPRTPSRIAGPAPVPADGGGHLDEHDPPVADLPEPGAPGLASQEGTDGPVEGGGLQADNSAPCARASAAVVLIARPLTALHAA